jgi:hypothetical protein
VVVVLEWKALLTNWCSENSGYGWLLWERFWVILNIRYLFVQRGCAFLCRAFRDIIGVVKDDSFNLATQYTSVALGLLSRKHM